MTSDKATVRWLSADEVDAKLRAGFAQPFRVRPLAPATRAPVPERPDAARALSGAEVLKRLRPLARAKLRVAHYASTVGAETGKILTKRPYILAAVMAFPDPFPPPIVESLAVGVIAAAQMVGNPKVLKAAREPLPVEKYRSVMRPTKDGQALEVDGGRLARLLWSQTVRGTKDIVNATVAEAKAFSAKVQRAFRFRQR